MSITFSIYDLFAYTVPGVLYLFTFNELSRSLGFKYIDIAQINTIPYLILIVAFGYLVGQVMDQVCVRLWVRIWYRKPSAEKAFDVFRKNYTAPIPFKPNQWSLLFAVIRHEDHPTADMVDRIIATSIMLRNASFGLLLFAFLQFFLSFRSAFLLPNFIIALTALVSSIISMQRNQYFNLMYYQIIFQHALLYREKVTAVIGEKVNVKSKNAKQ